MYNLNTWNEISDILEDKTIGNVKIDHFEINENKMGWTFRESIPKGRYVRLHIGNTLMMSNTPMEYFTNREFMEKAHGDILIGGLGLGCVLHCLSKKRNINSITVVEYSQDVIDAVLPQYDFGDNVKVIQGDVFKYKPDRKYNCIYMDIWAYINSDIAEEMSHLKRKYGHYLVSKDEDRKRYNDCWCYYEAKNNLRI